MLAVLRLKNTARVGADPYALLRAPWLSTFKGTCVWNTTVLFKILTVCQQFALVSRSLATCLVSAALLSAPVEGDSLSRCQRDVYIAGALHSHILSLEVALKFERVSQGLKLGT